MISPKDERLNFKEKGKRFPYEYCPPVIKMQRPISFIIQIAGKSAPEKRMKDKELLKIPKQVRPRPHRQQLRARATTPSLSRMPSRQVLSAKR